MEIGSIYEIDPNTFSDAAAYDASVFTLKEIKKYNKIHTAFTGSGRVYNCAGTKSYYKKQAQYQKNRPSSRIHVRFRFLAF